MSYCVFFNKFTLFLCFEKEFFFNKKHMKKCIVMLGAMLVLLASCTKDLKNQINELDKRLTDVENLVASMNTQLTKLQELIDGKLFITGVEDKEDGSHVVSFVNSRGELSTITIYDGQDGMTPDISVKQAPDGKWYWTVNGEWLYDAQGDKVPVTGERGVSPSIKIEDGKWYVSYDNGITYIECGQATGDPGDQFFKEVKLSSDGKYAYITLMDGTVLTLEVYKEFGIAISVESAFISTGQTKQFAYVITGADKNTELEVLAKGNWDAEVKAIDESNGFIVVSAPAEASTGKVVLLLSDGAGKTIMRTLTFVSGTMHVSTTSVDSPANGGTFEVEVTTDLTVTPGLEGNPTWAHLVSTKAGEVHTEKIAVSLDPNDTPSTRQCSLVLYHEGKVVETILICQAPATYPEEAMVLIVKPAERDSKVVFGVTYRNGAKYVIDWGDGSKKDTILNKSIAEHVYASIDRTYTVQITGELRALGRPSSSSHYNDIHELVQWGTLKLESFRFEGNAAITSIAAPKGDELANVSNCNSMFKGCKSLKQIPKALLWGLSPKTANFYSAFEQCESLEYLDPDIFAHFTQAKKVSLSRIFYNCKSLKTVPTFKYLNLYNDQNEFSMLFTGCESLEQIPEDMFNESAKLCIRAEKLGSTFMNCKSLKAIPESFWDNLPIDNIVELNNTFNGCSSLTSESLGFLNKLTKVYSWNATFKDCVSITTLPEAEIEVDGEKVSVPLFERGNYQDYFAGRSLYTRDAVAGCINLEGYYDKIPQSWGGCYDGTTSKPVISVSASYPEGNGYYCIDFNAKGQAVAEAYYYLSAKTLVDDVLPSFNNSYAELCNKRGIKIENNYLAALNSEQGLTLGFDQGVPNVEYILIVSGKNMHGESFAYKVKSTTEVPKGSAEYERYMGEWTVTSTASSTNWAEYDQHPVSFDIKIEPFRVDSIYNVYGWGVTKFTDVYPMKMYFEDGKLTAWTGAHHGSVIYTGYPYTDGISYNVALNSFMQNEDGSYSVYMASGEKVGEAEYAEGGFEMQGVNSKDYPNIKCVGFDFCLSMGGQGWSKIFIAPEVVRPELVIKNGDETYAPYIIGPFKFTRKSTAETTTSRTVGLNKKLLEREECLPVKLMVDKNAVAGEPVASGFYKIGR